MDLKQDGEKKVKEFGVHISASLVAAVIVKIINLILIKILTVFMVKEEYAIYSLLLSFIALLSTFSTTTFSESLARYLPRCHVTGKNGDITRLFSTVIVGSLIILTFILLTLMFTGFLGFEEIIQNESLWTIMIIGLLASIFNLKAIILVSSNSEQNSREVVSFNLIYTISASILAGVLAITIGSYETLLLGLTLGYGIPVMLTLIIKIKRYGLAAPSLTEFRSIAKYGYPFAIMNTIPYLVNFLSIYATGTFIGLPDMASFAIALAVTSFFSFAVSPPMIAYRAYVVATFESGRLDEENLITSKVIELYSILAVMFLWVIVTFADIIIQIISTVDYLDAVVLVPLTLFSAFLYTSTYFWRLRVDLSERTYLTGIASFLSLIPYIIGLVIFLPLLGIVGIGVAMCVQGLAAMIMIVYLGNREFRISLDGGFFVRWFGSVAVLVVSYLIISQIMLMPYLAAVLSLLCYVSTLFLTRAITVSQVKRIIHLLLG